MNAINNLKCNYISEEMVEKWDNMLTLLKTEALVEYLDGKKYSDLAEKEKEAINSVAYVDPDMVDVQTGECTIDFYFGLSIAGSRVWDDEDEHSYFEDVIDEDGVFNNSSDYDFDLDDYETLLDELCFSRIKETDFDAFDLDVDVSELAWKIEEELDNAVNSHEV